MPGPYRGRVVQVRHAGAVRDDNTISQPVVRVMLERGMCELTGAEHASDAWRSFFSRDDIIGIKVNPVGRAPRPGESGRVRNAVGSISSPALLLEIVAALKSIGVPGRNLFLFERYASEFREAGYESVLRERVMSDVRWFASGTGYSESQLSIDGHEPGQERDPHVLGYDRDQFVSMGFCDPRHSERDERRFNSHLSVIVTRLLSKMITVPCLKDHRSAGVTLALKNLSHGMNNNVARSHLSLLRHLGIRTGPNQCNTFIPTAVAQRGLRDKATLHILDGLIGVYEGGPGCWNATWATWRHQGLLFATDPVALDVIGWEILDAKRLLEGWQPVSRMGLQVGEGPVTFAPHRLALAATANPHAAVTALAERLRVPDGRASEVFDRRQPEHVLLAGILGLGEWRREHIHFRDLRWEATQGRWVNAQSQ
jgi:hypothetical protein